MKYINLLALTVVLVACSPDASVQSDVASQAKAGIAEDFNAAAASSPIATKILNSPQEQDILSSSRQAMIEVSASDIAAIDASMASQAHNTSPDVFADDAATALAPACHRYLQRAERCFSQATNASALLEMLRDDREALIQDNPSDAACVELNQSFNAVARNLGCD